MKTIIFIGVNKSGSSREAVKAAEQLGYYTVVFTDSEKQIKQRKEYPDIHQLILLDTINIEDLKEQIRTLQHKGNEITAITSFIDQHVYTASILADEFCRNCLSTDTIFIMENKEEQRKFFINEAFTPTFVLVEKEIPIPRAAIPTKLNYPVMVKNSKSCGSKDVLFADNIEQLQKSATRLREKYPDDAIIIEEYIDGEQYLVEVVVHKGQILIAAIIQQEITRGKRFIVTGYSVLAKVQSDIEEGIGKVVQSITSKLKIENGAYHLELRLGADGWKLIEINPRISGGAMNRMIQAAFGFNLVEETLKMLTGDTPSLAKKTNNFVFTQYVIIDYKGVLAKVTGKGRATRSPGVVEVYVKPRKGAIIQPPLSMGHRYAYVIATGETMEEAKQLAKEAAKEIEFHIIENE
ncbi:ATP-grasp domain-containing protein [Neobacillus sp. PS3-40]|uniref:ATP-grasp domain-containing protein n=1 Tax=Neobacillus sp. PS3-40 TaxID=3070679 RepID=UPI0027E1181A|nr:ATP-grasp domain-containing protein [Neobacillus sp. PS3-40]WML43451.1 ATP-grasp domain-containing protein [Neobacillus sp. PS3-40]